MRAGIGFFLPAPLCPPGRRSPAAHPRLPAPVPARPFCRWGTRRPAFALSSFPIPAFPVFVPRSFLPLLTYLMSRATQSPYRLICAERGLHCASVIYPTNDCLVCSPAGPPVHSSYHFVGMDRQIEIRYRWMARWIDTCSSP